MKEKFYIIEAKDINAGDILCDRFDSTDKYLVLDSTVDLMLLQICSGKRVCPTPLDLVNNFLRVTNEV